MTKTRTTKKPAAKPQRKPRTAVEARIRIDKEREDLSEAIGRSVAKELGRTLRDLMEIPEQSAVGAWSVTEGSPVGGATFTAHYDKAAPAPRQSALYEALDRLRTAITAGESITDATHCKLLDVLGPAIPATAGGPPICPPDSASAIVYAINEFADRIYADNRRRNELLDRLEL